MRQRKQRKRGAVVNYKGLRHDDVILGIHRYEVIGLSVGGLMADVAHLHGMRQGKTIKRATATLEGGRLHTLLFDCMQRVYALTPHCTIDRRL